MIEKAKKEGEEKKMKGKENERRDYQKMLIP